MEVKAVRFQLGNIFHPTKLVTPDAIAYERGRVTVTKRKWFGLGRSQDDIGIGQVGSVELHSGLFNATVVVQTSVRGGLDLSIENLPKKQAEALVREIRGGAR